MSHGDARLAARRSRALRIPGGTSLGGNRPPGALSRSLTKRGTLVIAGGEEGDRWIGGIDRQLHALALSPFVSQPRRALVAEPKRQALEFLAARLESENLRVAHERTYPLGEAAEAMRLLQSGRVRGKVALTP